MTDGLRWVTVQLTPAKAEEFYVEHKVWPLLKQVSSGARALEVTLSSPRFFYLGCMNFVVMITGLVPKGCEALLLEEAWQVQLRPDHLQKLC